MIDGQLDLAGARAVTDAERREAWLAYGLRAIARLPRRFQVSADDLRAVQPEWAADCPSPALWGSLFRRACAEKLIRFDGFQKSTTPARRGGIQQVWLRT